MSAGTEERVVTKDDPLTDSEIVHIACCRRFGKTAVCGIDLTGHEMVETEEPACVVCVDMVEHEIEVQLIMGRNHTHCPIDKKCCPPPREG